MPTIIKPGKLQTAPQSKLRFLCPTCGCIFECTGDEITVERRMFGYATALCPTDGCDTIVKTINKRNKEESQ